MGEKMAKNILVVGELKSGALRKTTLEAITAAQGIAAKTGGGVAAVLVGSGLDAAAAQLAAHGAVVHQIDDAAYAQYASESYTDAITRAARERDASIVLFSDTSFGKDLAPAVAVRLDAALATDVVAVEASADGRLTVVHPIYTGKLNAEYALAGKPFTVVSLRPNIFPAAAAAATAGKVEKLDWKPASPPRAVVRETVSTSAGKVELTEADIIVSGGRSLKSAENFAIIEALADVLGAAVGASRAAVDAGYQPHSRQVGQTGKVVNPSLYVACGISGAIQHLVGMRTSKVIVAINKDANAPIFQNADYGIVGDLFEVVPALTEELRTALGK
jgi:electron transfer flavoprotein alpha subunit